MQGGRRHPTDPRSGHRNVLGLTLGVLSCLVIYLYVSFEFSYDKSADLRRETTGFSAVTGLYTDDTRVLVPVAGNPSTALQKPFSVLLTESEARRYFGNGDPAAWMGRSLIYYDSLTVSVTGIVKDWQQNSDFGFKDPISYNTIEHSFLQRDMQGWNMWQSNVNAYVKLSPGTTVAIALVTVSFQAIRAATANPVDSLRSE